MNQTCDKELALKIVKLLSALEASGLMSGDKFPDYLSEELRDVIDILSKEILK